MQDRLSKIREQLSFLPAAPLSGLEKLRVQRDDDVVVCCAVRSPLGKANSGSLKDTAPDMLLHQVLEGLLERTGVDPTLVEDVSISWTREKDPIYKIRGAALAAGFPHTTTVQSMNRLCTSGMSSVAWIANAIRCGDIEMGVAGGVESMSTNPRPEPSISEELGTLSSEATDALNPMGWTSENIAKDFSFVTREAVDAYAAVSHQSALAAMDEGRFVDQIIPVRAVKVDPMTKERSEFLLSEDDKPRRGTTAASLGKLRPAFPQWGAVSTAGNSSQITDGAAALLLTTRAKAKSLGLPVMATYVAQSMAGVPPRIMGIGPSAAVPKLLARLGIEVKDVGLWEINEAFGTMAVYCQQKLGIERSKMNVNGGAIALGHPIGCTGIRLMVTGIHEMQRRDEKALCVTIMGVAQLFVR
ncbi:hypothetical protein RQP46_006258 [Phenoliferia psychrophenolica]